MKLKWIYAGLCVLGTVLPYTLFAPFLIATRFDLSLLVTEIQASPVTAFFAADVVVSSLVLWVFIYQETRTQTIPLWWLAVVANLLVGVSLGLPLFLLLREIQRDRNKHFR